MPTFNIDLAGFATVVAKDQNEAHRQIVIMLAEFRDAYMKWDHDPVQEWNIEVRDMEQVDG